MQYHFGKYSLLSSGESTFQNDTANNNHCNAVATFAAGNDTGGSDNIPWFGVAPDADLVLSSIPDFSGSQGTAYALDLDAARTAVLAASKSSAYAVP